MKDEKKEVEIMLSIPNKKENSSPDTYLKEYFHLRCIPLDGRTAAAIVYMKRSLVGAKIKCMALFLFRIISIQMYYMDKHISNEQFVFALVNRLQPILLWTLQVMLCTLANCFA